MNLVRRVVHVIADRAVAVVGSLFAARLETLAVLEQAEQENELEERARLFDNEGKPELAAALRARAAEINPDVPAALGRRVLCHLEEEQTRADRPLLECPAGADGRPAAEETDRPSRGRRSSGRRTSRRASEKEAVEDEV